MLKNAEREPCDKAGTETGTKKIKESTRLKSGEKVKEKKIGDKMADKAMCGSENTARAEPSAVCKPNKEVHKVPEPANRLVTDMKEEAVAQHGLKNPIQQSTGMKEEKCNSKQLDHGSVKEGRIRNKDRPAMQIYKPGAKRLATQKMV